MKEYHLRCAPLSDGSVLFEQEFEFNFRDRYDTCDSDWFIENCSKRFNGDGHLLPSKYYFTSGLHCSCGYKDDPYIANFRNDQVH